MTKTLAPHARPRAFARTKAVVGVAVSVSLASNTAAFATPTKPSDAEVAQATTAVNDAESSLTDLVSQVSSAESELQDLERAIGADREAANRALVDLHDAQIKAEQARRGVEAARAALEGTQEEIEEAQKILDEISNATYRMGSKPSTVSASGATNAEDTLARQSYLRTQVNDQREVIDQLDELRTQQANTESRERKTTELAEQRAQAAEQAQADAEAQVASSQAAVDAKLEERAAIIAAQANVQSALDAARGNAANLEQQRNEYEQFQAAEAQRQAAQAAQQAAEEAAAQAAQAAQSAAEEASQEVTESTTESSAATTSEAATDKPEQETQSVSDAAAIAAAARDAVEQTRNNTANATAAADEAAAAIVAASQPDHTSTDDPYQDSDATSDLLAVQNEEAVDSDTAEELNLDTAETAASVTENASSAVSASASEQIETVIARAKSQLGVPYVWGGGNANGPTGGIRDGGSADSHGEYSKVGFDCSGLVLYAFAGVGISLPHYTGYQYQRGTKINAENMQRGDLIFWGPNAEQHVAIYLGDGQMIEAPNSGSVVRVTSVRWSGMSPYVVRLIQ
ncbi:MAG: NlpC/P60 family protein [Corynebacterium sp.]|nr:NlpC/P60 family protein [Corynebacterium sp.]